MFKGNKYFENSCGNYFKSILILEAFVFIAVNGIMLERSSCNCILARDCEPYTSRLLESSLEERKILARQMRNAFCGLTYDGVPKVCCPRKTTSPVQTRFGAFSISHAVHLPDNHIFAWHGQYPNTYNEEANLKYDPQHYDIQTHHAGHKIRHTVANPFEDYKDKKTLLNCPNVFYEEAEDPSVVHNHFHSKRVKSAIVYPDDKRLLRNHHNSPADNKETKEMTSNNKNSVVKNLKTGQSIGVNSPECGLIGRNTKNTPMSEVQQFPWITRIGYRNITSNRIGYRCSGSFISDSYILTAAHCVTNLNNDLQLSHVRLAETHTKKNCLNMDSNSETPCNPPSPSSKILEISNVIVHPNYDNRKRANDVALIKIIKTSNTLNIGTICLPLPMETENELINTTGVVASWTNSKGNDDILVKVKYLRLPIVSRAECIKRYEEYNENNVDPITITSTMLCAQGQPMNEVCQGDSGGPFMDDGSSGNFGASGRYTLLGTVSFGPPCGSSSWVPDIYMRISEYFNWILDNAK